jgi:cytochrome c oxidase accessory protein FixG
MAVHPQPVQAPGRVLSTLNADGSRRRIRPRVSPGPWWRQRRVVAYALMLVFFALPYLRMNGKPPILLDLPRREFTLFGTTFLPTETLLFMLLFLSVAIAVFFVTAIWGRVWCGWGCPQTVYMEYLFRPLEYWLEGGPRGAKKLDRRRAPSLRRVLKLAIFFVLSMILAHTFLAYFVGLDQLVHWVRSSPQHHPVAFAVMAGTTLAIFLDFGWFREQTCLVACPYGRLQTVLFDRRTMIVGYDPKRGEPRMRGLTARPADAGDCINCELCVLACPTGIDIRDGLQMECIHCTQCIDACDTVMERIGKPRGLIRYASRSGLERSGPRGARVRVILYPLALAVTLGLFLFFLANRASTEVTLLRGTGAPYQFGDDGTIVNEVRLKFSNRGHDERRYRLELVGTPDARLIAPINPFPVGGGRTLTTTVFVVSGRASYHRGERQAIFRVEDGEGFGRNYLYRMPGPEHDDHGEHDEHDGNRGPKAPDARDEEAHR